MWPPVTRVVVAYLIGLAAAWVAAPAPTLALGVGALSWITLRERGPRGILLAVAGVGVAVGGASAGAARGRCATAWPAGPVRAIVQVHDVPRAWGRTTARVRHTASGCGGVIRLAFEAPHLPSGSVVVIVGAVNRYGATAVHHLRPLRGHPIPWRFRVRDAMARRLEALYGPRAPAAQALILGRRTDLAPEVRRRFVQAGLAHLLAISGLHVGIVATWIAVVSGWLLSSRGAGITATLGVWVYVGLLGAPASAVRAATFLTVYAASRLRQRRPPLNAVLAVAAIALVSWDPQALTSVGAWLSVTAVAGSSLVLPRGSSHRGWLRLVRASIGATVGTAPVTALVFGQVAPIGVFSSVVGIPLTAVVVPAVFASAVVGAPLAWGAGLGLGGLDALAAAAARVPGGHWESTPGLGFAAPWFAGLGGVAWIVLYRPGWRRVVRRVGLGLAAAGIVRIALVARAGPDRGEGLTIHALPVGQGDAVAVRTPRGRWLLIDAGPASADYDAGARVVVPFLRRQGVRRLDLAVVSHGDADHVGGMATVVRALRPRRVVEPGQPLSTPAYRAYLDAVRAVGAEWTPARAGDRLVVDSVVLTVLHPTAAWLRAETRPNENSLVVHLAYGGFDALFTGDAGWPVESALLGRLPRVELLKVGHHGSRSSTSEALLQATRPTVAVISVGRNPFGHPTSDVLARLRARGIRVYRTDRDGRVTIRATDDYFLSVPTTPAPLVERLRCRFPTWLRSSASSTSRSVCRPTPPASFPISSTTLPSRPRSSRATYAARDSSTCWDRSGAPTCKGNSNRSLTSWPTMS